MSENEQSSTRSWLSVSQAAAALGISERTARRMCESGKLAATIETGNNGGRIWRVDRAAISERAAMRPNDRADSVRPNRAATEKTSVRPHFERENERAAISANVVRPTVRPERAAKNESVRPTENNALLIAEKNERIADLRAIIESQKLQIEAANRQAAEATAALREYLKMQAKALPESISSTQNDGKTSRENASQQPINAAMGKVSQDIKNAAQNNARREMRPLWKVILGVR